MAEQVITDLCRQTIKAVADEWGVTDDRVEWRDDGLDWWPGTFRVMVRVAPSLDEQQPHVCRLTIRTNVLKGVVVSPTVMPVLEVMAALAPTYGAVFMSERMRDRFEQSKDGAVWFQSSGYVIPDTLSWLPSMVAALALLQVVDGLSMGEVFAQGTGGVVDADVKPGFEELHTPDRSIRFVDEEVGKSKGDVSRWHGISEFEECAEQFGRSDSCFGMGSPTDLTLETPFGADSALVQLHTDQVHPRHGAGLLATLQIRAEKSHAEMLDDCADLNLIESIMWTDVPQLGSWQPRKVDDVTSRLAHSVFIPNAFYRPGLATNVAMWQIRRAMWIKRLRWPELPDCTMAEVLERRFGANK